MHVCRKVANTPALWIVDKRVEICVQMSYYGSEMRSNLGGCFVCVCGPIRRVQQTAPCDRHDEKRVSVRLSGASAHKVGSRKVGVHTCGNRYPNVPTTPQWSADSDAPCIHSPTTLPKTSPTSASKNFPHIHTNEHIVQCVAHHRSQAYNPARGRSSSARSTSLHSNLPDKHAFIRSQPPFAACQRACS